MISIAGPKVILERMTPSLESFPLLAIPLFVFAGNLLNVGGIADRIFAFAKTLVAHIHGGLAHVNILASIVFSGMSGVAAADAAGDAADAVDSAVDEAAEAAKKLLLDGTGEAPAGDTTGSDN